MDETYYGTFRGENKSGERGWGHGESRRNRYKIEGKGGKRNQVTKYLAGQHV